MGRLPDARDIQQYDANMCLQSGIAILAKDAGFHKMDGSLAGEWL